MTRFTLDGLRIRVWEREPYMLTVPQMFLDACFYLYETPTDAKKARGVGGGSGFLVGYWIEQPYIQIYAVTNKHVIDGGAGVLRLNRRDKTEPSIFQTQYKDWHFHPDGDDLAVYPIELAQEHSWNQIPVDCFVTMEMNDGRQIGIGDNVFLIGRLAGQESTHGNNPVCRFGQVASHLDRIKLKDQKTQMGFFADCRSVSGHSGSPVMLWRDKDQPLALSFGDSVGVMPMDRPSGLWLLGVDFCHVGLQKAVIEVGPGLGIVKNTRYRSEQNTGITGVIPAWRLREILESEELMAQREKTKAELPPPRHREYEEAETVLDGLQDEREEPFTEENFLNALKRVSRKKQSDEGKSGT